MQAEYKKLLTEINRLKSKLNNYEKGYIRVKVINGKSYTYIQFREVDKVRSYYIKPADLERIKKSITERKEIEHQIQKLTYQKKKLESELGIHNYIPEKNIDYDEYSMFMSTLAHDHKRLGIDKFLEKYDTTKFRGLKKRYLKGYIDYITGNNKPNTRKSNNIVLDPYTYLMYTKYGNKSVMEEELKKAIPQFLNQGLLITNVQEAVKAASN